MKKNVLMLLFILVSLLAAQGQTFAPAGIYVEESPATGTGLSAVYVFRSLTGASVAYTTAAGNTVGIYRYQTSQTDATAVSAGDIATSTAGGQTTYTLSNLQDARGYIFEDNNQRRGIFVIDYSQHASNLGSISVAENEYYRCQTLDLFVSRGDDDLAYYGLVSGVQRQLTRQYQLQYNTLKWNSENLAFETVNETLTYNNPGTDIQVDAPLADTYFTFSGDQYARQFGITASVSTDTYTAVAAEGHIVSQHQARENTNEVKPTDTSVVGGSAPATINFYANANEPVARYYNWYIYKTSDLTNPIVRYPDRDISYTFAEFGNYRVVLETTDHTSSCTYTDSVSVNIADSYLDIPNFFTPGDSPGSNDEFRVAYRSLVSFRCVIFNRWGTKIYEFSDPAQGWDGRSGGKLVSPGVYFYNIEATGADGIKYRRRGDINILRSK